MNCRLASLHVDMNFDSSRLRSFRKVNLAPILNNIVIRSSNYVHPGKFLDYDLCVER